MTRAKQHFLENLYYKVNKLATGPLENSSVFSATMFDLITGELTTDELAQMPLKDLAELLNKKGHGKFAQPEKLAKALQKAILPVFMKTEELEAYLPWNWLVFF